MKRFRYNKLWILMGLLLAGCAALQNLPVQTPGDATLRPVARPGATNAIPPDTARTAEEFDTTTQEQRAAAIAQADPVGKPEIGRTIASLGNPAEPGFWLKTPLVSQPGPGRVVYAVTGQSVTVDLIPSDGPATGGSRISLAAMRLLGAPLTALPELILYAQ